MTVGVLPEVEARHTPDALEREIVAFEEAIREFQSGSLSEDEWRRFRLTHGTYGQRQPGVQMLRVKIVAGLLSSEQLLALAEIADSYSTGRGHLTTRENVQFHFVQLENVPKAMRLLAKAGLTTREACFNTVRNVTACPISGICPTEAFDVTPYALGISRFLLRHPDFNNMPRKFKIAFSGCEDDGNCAVAGIHDIGLIAQIRTVNGVEKRGFRVLVGGGLGSLPTEAALLTDFLPEEELIPTTEAILRVFDESGNRKNKMMARLKFVLRAKGIEEFRRMVAEKRKTVQTPALVYTRPSSQAAPLVQISAEPLSAASSNGHSDPEYAAWAKHNVMQQRQPGYAAIWIKLPAGTLYSGQMRGLAKLLDFHKLPGMRIAINQDLVLPWVPTNLVHAIHDELRTLDLVTPGARTIADVTGLPRRDDLQSGHHAVADTGGCAGEGARRRDRSGSDEAAYQDQRMPQLVRTAPDCGHWLLRKRAESGRAPGALLPTAAGRKDRCQRRAFRAAGNGRAGASGAGHHSGIDRRLQGTPRGR